MPDPRKIVHLDMDAFYASVEQRDDPRLRGQPVAVGGTPENRGVVAAASYEARKFGVRSAMPAKTALRLCPSLLFVPPDFAKYSEVSREIRSFFYDVTDLVEPLSLDEAYLDVTENKLGEPSATRIAQHLRARIRGELHLTASAGVAPVKFVAKIASDYRKPDGLTVVAPGQVLRFIRDLPVERLWGVGPATARRIHALGVTKIGQLAALDEDVVVGRLGSQGQFLWRMAHGHDPRPVRPSRERKSRGSERTFPEDLTELADVLASLDRQIDRVCDGSEDARTVTLKVRYGDFTTITRAQTLPAPTAHPDAVRAAIRELVERTEIGSRPVRLVGVSLSNFGTGDADPMQLPLPFPDDDQP